MAKRRSLDLIIIMSLTVCSFLLIMLLPQVRPWLAVLALPLVLIFPGYSLLVACFPRKALSGIERLLFSLGLSVVCVILCGLLLNTFPIGLQTHSWVTILSIVTLVCCLISFWLRRGAIKEGIMRRRRRVFLLRPLLLFILAAVVLASAVGLSYASAIQQEEGQPVTQLWLLPDGQAGNQQRVRLGVATINVSDGHFSLQVRVDNLLVRTWPHLSLGSSQHWETTVLLSLPKNARHITAVLSQAQQPFYRQTALDVSPASKPLPEKERQKLRELIEKRLGGK